MPPPQVVLQGRPLNILDAGFVAFRVVAVVIDDDPSKFFLVDPERGIELPLCRGTAPDLEGKPVR